MGGTTHKLRPSPYLLQVTSQTLFFPVRNYPPHTFRSERTPESHNLTPFKEGDKVWLESRYLKLHYKSKKLAPKWEGPFKVLEVLSPLNYQLELPKSWQIHPVIHITLLSPYKENDIHGTNYTTPPPDLIEGEHEYEVEAIISHKKQGRGHC